MKKKDQEILLIKNMVCQRCISTVESILNSFQIPYNKVSLGEAELTAELDKSKLEEFDKELKKVGFELIENRVSKIIEDIKLLVLEYVNDEKKNQKTKLSKFITNKIHYDYSYLSDLFSAIEGKTIEKYFIDQRIEKVKELLVYDQLSLTEISYQTGFSSVHHLSAQFKKVTGLTPSYFKSIGTEKRKSINNA